MSVPDWSIAELAVKMHAPAWNKAGAPQLQEMGIKLHRMEKYVSFSTLRSVANEFTAFSR